MSELAGGCVEVRPWNFRRSGKTMKNFIENNQDQIANGQVRRDLRVNSDGTAPETLLDPVNVAEHYPNAAPEEFPAPIGKLLTIASSGAGRATVEFEASGRYANPMGTLHGGVLCDLADAAMGVAYLSTLAEGETATTIELKINFLRPVWNAKLRAEARVVRAGKVVGLIECDILDERRRLVARASSTSMTLRGRLAQGRQAKRNQLDELRSGQSKENRKRELQRRGSQFLLRQVDADERLPGYLHEPHLPRFESPSARAFAGSVSMTEAPLRPPNPSQTDAEQFRETPEPDPVNTDPIPPILDAIC
jgi:uncharacterized protein (TIGR00369 family)